MMGVNAMGEISDIMTMCVPEADVTQYRCIPSVIITSFDSQSTITEELENNGVDGIVLRFEKIPSTVEDAPTKAKEIWASGFQNLVIHLGTQSMEKTVTLEQQAYGDGYDEVPEGFETGEDLQTEVDCNSLVEEISPKFDGLTIEKSEDPGRDLDGLFYYSLLRERASSSLLIKLPSLDEECTKEALAQIVREVLLIQLKEYL